MNSAWLAFLLCLGHCLALNTSIIACDIVVGGGSTAAFAAAITAAEAAKDKIVCLTEMTDWLGGQMTAGGVPAIDFGGSNKIPEN